MKVKDLECQLHLPKKLLTKIHNGREIEQMLPAYAKVKPYPVDMYPSCPKSWIRGSYKESSYFIGVEEDKGMWLNFNDCYRHTHDVAIVISIQGINPITGLKTDNLRLEKYSKNCPIHNVPFQSENFCPVCKFKWPNQNYLCTTGTSEGSMWLDGFRCSDDSIRQYVFTSEVMKGIAAQLIGEDRVYAIGIAFYLSKKPKEEKSQANDHSKDRIGKHNASISYIPEIKGWDFRVVDSRFDRTICQGGSIGYHIGDKPNQSISWTSTTLGSASSGSVCSHLTGMDNNFEGPLIMSNLFVYEDSQREADLKDIENQLSTVVNDPNLIMITSQSIHIEPVEEVRKLEIAAGALIKQSIKADTKELDYWEEEPQGMIYINYTDMKTFESILNNGRIEEKSEGFLQSLNKI